MSGSTLETGGVTSSSGTAAALVGAQTAGTHVGTSSVPFSIYWGGCCLSYVAGTPFIAEPALYAAIVASGANANITWSD